jgi:hypothetical protein
VIFLVLPSVWAAEPHVMFTPDTLQWTDTPVFGRVPPACG